MGASWKANTEFRLFAGTVEDHALAAPGCLTKGHGTAQKHLMETLAHWPREVFEFVIQTIRAFLDDNAIRMAAALAFYTMFSIVPAFLMGMSVAGLVIGNIRAESELIARFEYLINPESAEYVLSLLNILSSELTNKHLSAVAVIGAVVAGTAVFVEMQSSLNTICGVVPGEKSGFLSWMRSRVISFVCVVGIGILLLAAVITNTVLSTVSSFFARAFFIPPEFLSRLYLVTQFGMIPVLLVLIYKLIPERNMEWKSVLVGSAVTSFLFLGGKYVFGIYLTSSVLKSVYGAAGSLFLLLVWVYYSAQVFYFGAEVTKVYATRYGSWGNQGGQSAIS